MANEAQKTGITEAGVAAAIVGILETAQRALGSGESPLIPDPWGPIILAGLGFAVVVARYFQKRNAA